MSKSVKNQKTHKLNLTKFELLHLRDVLSVVLPPALDKTLSQSLAELENRSLVESMLWKKVSVACSEAKIPIGNNAPDYVVAPTGSPPMAVFQLSADPTDDENSEQESAGFIDEHDTEDC